MMSPPEIKAMTLNPAITPDELYDVTGDCDVDITDVNAIINKMLGK